MNQMSRWDFPKAKKITHEFKYIYVCIFKRVEGKSEG